VAREKWGPAGGKTADRLIHESPLGTANPDRPTVTVDNQTHQSNCHFNWLFNWLFNRHSNSHFNWRFNWLYNHHHHFPNDLCEGVGGGSELGLA
jgi:hypothetical protein